MPRPSRNRRDAPPPYTVEQDSPTPTSETPSDYARVPRPHPSQDRDSSMYPSLDNEQSSLLNPNNRAEGYRTMPQTSPRRKRVSALSIITIILITTIVNVTLFIAIRELDPIARERVRRGWDKEIQRHEDFVKHAAAVRAEWIIEDQVHEKHRSAMAIERRTWQAEREKQERKLSELRLEVKRSRHDWELEKWDHEREWQKRWYDEEAKLSKLHETIEQDRRDWETEKRNREREWQKRQEEYDEEMERRQQREDEERRRREEEDERRWAETRWEDLYPSQKCLAYGTREYTAKLAGNRVCRETSAEIHGVVIRPKHCDDNGGGTWGTWVVDFQEPTCRTTWSGLTDKGCVGSRTRRYEQHLDDVPWGSDWEQMCSTAPADINGRHFDTPTACVNRGLWGMYGYWDIEDWSC